MGLETSVADKRGKELSGLGTNPNPRANANSRGKKGWRRHNKKIVSPVQKLYDTCKEVFAYGRPGIVPSPNKIEKLKAVLDKITAADVGLNPERPHFLTPATWREPAIRYLHLYENNDFSMGIFCLPPSGVIPLHNHPGMTVFSKLLFGTMHIKSYDWVVDPAYRTSAVLNPCDVKKSEVWQPEARLAKVKINSNHTASCDTRILYPAEGGNMHCFTAVTPCAVLDVVAPPYSEPDGRHCQYYSDFPFTNFSVDGLSVPEEERENYAWLQERDNPDDLLVVVDRYSGPEIVEN